MPKVYIIGPMRGIPELNAPAFDKATALGKRLGYEVVSPVDVDRSLGESMDDLPWGGGTPDSKIKIAKRDLDLILGFNPAEDAVALLPAWYNSLLGPAEFMLARAIGLKILDAENFRPYAGKGMEGARLGDKVDEFLDKNYDDHIESHEHPCELPSYVAPTSTGQGSGTPPAP